jgi:hypothetical protein
MKTTSPKGMRHITTIQSIRSRSVPSSSEQIMTELSRLEHEKGRLERERKIWIENQHKTRSGCGRPRSGSSSCGKHLSN